MGDAVLESVAKVPRPRWRARRPLRRRRVRRRPGEREPCQKQNATGARSLPVWRCHSSSMSIAGRACRASVSIGLVCFPEEADTIEDLIKLSDSAMYASRRSARISRAGRDEQQYDPRTAAVLSEILPLMTAPGDVCGKLQLVAKRSLLRPATMPSTSGLAVHIKRRTPRPRLRTSRGSVEAWHRRTKLSRKCSYPSWHSGAYEPAAAARRSQHDERLTAKEREIVLAAGGFVRR